MIHHATSAFRRQQCSHRFDAVRGKIANSLVGSAVSLMVGPDAILHGRVSSVKIEAGRPKLMVAGMPYDLDQVVVAVPGSLPE